MRRELLIAVGPGEWRAVWLEDGIAAELHVERGDIRPVGSIHLGRVVRRLDGLDAVLVDIGEQRPGFLPTREPPSEGARICVQVRREAQRDKGARLAINSAESDAEPARLLEPPAQLTPRPGFAPALAPRLPALPERLWTDETAVLRELRAVFPDAEIIPTAPGDWPIDLDAAFDTALAPDLALPGGGSVHFAETAAAVLIDVDTGVADGASLQRSADAVNRAAVPMVARQLRLRQLGGGILIDFAALDGKRRRERLRQAMEAVLATDPAKPRILGWSGLGHLEIVRPRRRRSLSDAMLDERGSRKNAETLAFEALRCIQREARAWPAASWRLTVSSAVAAALQGPAAAALRSLEARLGRPIRVIAARQADRADFDIAPLRDDITADGKEC